MTDLVHADHVTLRYGASEIFSDVSFTIEPHSFTSIVGPNGAGKTQLMRVIIGLVTPSAGVLLRNFTMHQIGYVPQRLYVHPALPVTVREFIQLYITPRGLWRSVALPTFDPKFSIDHLMNKPLGKLSGGQLQRVILATVLSTQPQILFLDEFSSGIDPQGQAELFGYLHRLHEQAGLTIIMISHDLDITSQYADQVLCLNKNLICHGRPRYVFTAENLEKMYGIPLTKLERHHHHD
ncbi:MAG: metal ABC transporter ATP-binding protein [Candidatus Kerfeldbacteria bacterium]|nr:metal ABC transporter ATP-binding protein [Candidatus Kerfeldbacteria bacterium]